MKIVWGKQYEIGIGVIDNQHQRIVEYINELDRISSLAAPREAVKEVFDNLIDYTFSHFAFEEALMEEAGYQDVDVHRLSHETFTRQITAIQQRFDQGDAVIEQLSEVLLQWLLVHIANDDVSYSALVKQNIIGKGAEAHKSWVSQAVRRFFG
ncbi:hemerythrin [Pseudomonas pohangensis]|jgi:hemerythrin|uniref:Hemerythrin n=1 Tax=Pseudomonas pohangensis TaxID=364197 RepID=A0A1H2HV94_9PSED|nr:bacteriohemerythrin [Pseudomonas pohangensis]SDU35810.1 hemerythrin [Pseudomonas pohangensis]